MSKFLKQFVFVSLGVAILTVGGVIIYGATAGGNLKINPILGHDLDLNRLYYGRAGNNTVHDITTQDISVSAWVKVDVDASAVLNYVILNKNMASNGSYIFYVASTKLSLYIKDDGGDAYSITGNTDLRDNKWHYVTGIIDKSDTTQCKIYLDGVENGTTNKSGTLANVGSLTNTANATLGVYSGLTNKLDGQIRDVKLYYAAGDHWSDAQVLYQAQHPFDYTANAGTTTDYWRLDEGSGTTLYGKVNNLTLSNVLAWTTQPKIKMVKQENTTTTGNNPVGWWKMDEGTGQYAFDVSGNGNTGTLGTSTVADGADPTWTTGKLGKGLSFDGVNDYVISTPAPITAYPFTISYWTKNIVEVLSGGITSADNATVNKSFGCAIQVNNTVSCFLYNTTYSGITGTKTIANNEWVHIVGVYESATNRKQYVNGVLDGTNTANVAFPSSLDNFCIGSLQRSTPNYYPGIIDDVRIYNRALTAGEVAQMYNSTKDGYLGNIKVSTGLVGYWKLDDNNALTSVIDYSGKGNTGTAYSGTATTTSVLSTSTAMIGRAMSFDGGDDYVAIADNVSLQPTNEVTAEVWIKPSFIPSPVAPTGKDWGILAKGVAIGTFQETYSLTLRGSVIRWRSIYNVIDSGTEVSAGTVIGGAWNHIVGVYKRGSFSKLYINGVQVGNVTPLNEPLRVGAYLLKIGYGQQNPYAYYFNGLIDEVKIWNYARSAEQIKQDYERGLRGLP